MRLQSLRAPKAFHWITHIGYKRVLGALCKPSLDIPLCILPSSVRDLCCCTQTVQLTRLCCRVEQAISEGQSLLT